MTAQAHRINIEVGRQSVFEALSTAEGWSRWFTPEVTGDFTDGSEVVCRLNGRSPVRLRVTSVQPGSAISFEALEGPFAAPGATTSIQLSSGEDGRRPPARHAADTRGGPGRLQHVLGDPPRPASRVLPDA